MSDYNSFAQKDLRLVYRVLHQHLTEHLELMDCEFVDGLQSHLQSQARSEGVDITDHSQWDRWLGNKEANPCEVRNQGRKIIPFKK